MVGYKPIARRIRRAYYRLMSKLIEPIDSRGDAARGEPASRALNKMATRENAGRLLDAIKAVERFLIPAPGASPDPRPAPPELLDVIGGAIDAAEPVDPSTVRLVHWVVNSPAGFPLRASLFHVTYGDGSRLLCNGRGAPALAGEIREYSELPERGLMGDAPALCICCHERAGGVFGAPRARGDYS